MASGGAAEMILLVACGARREPRRRVPDMHLMGMVLTAPVAIVGPAFYPGWRRGGRSPRATTPSVLIGTARVPGHLSRRSAESRLQQQDQIEDQDESDARAERGIHHVPVGHDLPPRFERRGNYFLADFSCQGHAGGGHAGPHPCLRRPVDRRCGPIILPPSSCGAPMRAHS
jgi:hypothetical protein